MHMYSKLKLCGPNLARCVLFAFAHNLNGYSNILTVPVYAKPQS